MAGEAKQHSPIDPMGGKLKIGADNSGGYMEDGVQGRKVPVKKGEGGPGQKTGIDPQGGPLKVDPQDSGGRMEGSRKAKGGKG